MIRLLTEFFNEVEVQALILLIALDFLLGVTAAIKGRYFRLAYVADFMRNDVLGKVFPFALLYGGLRWVGDAVEINGTTLGALTWGAYAVIVGAMAGSIMRSLAELKLLPRTIRANRSLTAPE